MRKRIVSRWRQALFTLAGFAVLLAASSCQRAPEPPGFYRFDDNLDQAAAARISPPAKVDAASWFEFDEPEAHGWTAGKESSSCTVKEGVLTFETKGDDNIESPDNIRIDTRDGNADSILIRMKAASAPWVRLRWRSLKEGYTPLGEVRIYVTQQGRWHTYKINSLHLPQWRNRTICQLRIGVGSPGRLEIDSIRTLSRRAAFSHEEMGQTQHRYYGDSTMRTCLYMRCPGEIEHRLMIPEGAHMSTGLGIIDSATPVSFSILARDPGSQETLFNRQVDESGVWVDARIDLSKYANKEVDVILKTDSQAAQQVAFWSNPILYKPKPREQQTSSISGRGERASSRRPGNRAGRSNMNVVLYVIDALRPDHLDAYGYSRTTAPAIRTLAEEGVRFARCFSQDTWTKPSVSSIFTGVPAPAHGVRQVGDMVADSLAVLPEILRRNGYATVSVIENGFCGAQANLSRGFSHVSRTDYEWSGTTNDECARFVEMHKDRNFFLYVHTMEVHAVNGIYHPPKQLGRLYAPSEQEASNVDRYDACIAAANSNLRQFISTLKGLGVYDDTLLIVAADHGEAFGEHEGMFFHNGKPYNELVHIPLIMHLPSVLPAGKVIEQNVQLLDLAPTILDVLGFTVPDQFQGTSLVPLIMDNATDAFRDRLIYSDGQEAASLIKGNWKLLSDEEEVRLYDLSADFAETKSVAVENRAVALALMDQLTEYRTSQEILLKSMRSEQTDDMVQMDAAEIERLKDLGYVK